MILVVSHPGDPHAATVMEQVRLLGDRCALLDLSSIPRQTGLSFSAGRGRGGAAFTGVDGVRLEASEIEAVWWRRPRPYVIDEALSPAYSAWATVQVHAALSGIWGSLRAGWMNEPWADERASHKPAQLAAAEAAGLTVPPTLVTCVPEDARTFLGELGDAAVIQKPLRPTGESWRPTRFVTSPDRDRLDDLRLAPAILQAYVPGVDIRVTVAGGRVLATAIDARQTSSPQDFRSVYAQCLVSACRLPADVEAGVLAMVEALGLRYAAVDFRRSNDGRHHFLEANPAGQWLFLEDRTGQPITRAVAEALVEATRSAALQPAPRGRPILPARVPWSQAC
jgi:hypothetical protein